MFSNLGPVPVSLAIDFSAYEDDWRHITAFRGQTGWLLMARATIQSEYDLLSSTLVVACDEHENPIPSWRAIHLTQCQWSGLDYCQDEPPDILDDLLCEEEGALYARWQRHANTELAALHDRVQRSMETLDANAAIKARQIDRQISELRRQRRMNDDEEERRTLTYAIANLEHVNDTEVERLTLRRNALRRRADGIEESLWQKTDVLIEVEPVRLIRWRDGHLVAEREMSSIWEAGHFYAPTAPTAEVEQQDANLVMAEFKEALSSKAELMRRAKAEAARMKVKLTPSPPQPQKPEVVEGTYWTYKRLLLLRHLWNEGVSANEIAAQLGGIDHNALIGKAYRIGLPKRLSPQNLAPNSNPQP